MMKSRLESTQHEAQRARNLLLWGQEVFLWADPWADKRLWESGARRGAGEAPAVGLGVSPTSLSSPKIGGLGG
jgi:hypothetical protein